MLSISTESRQLVYQREEEGNQLICVVSIWQDVKRRHSNTREKTAAGKGRLLLACGEEFQLARSSVMSVMMRAMHLRTGDARRKNGLLGSKSESGNH